MLYQLPTFYVKIICSKTTKETSFEKVNMNIILNGKSFSLSDLVKVTKGNAIVTIAKENETLVNKANAYVLKVAKEEKAVYGINTGFGVLANVKIPSDKLSDAQLNLLKSHACGVGKKLPEKTVRAMMALRVNALIQGNSGISLQTINQILLLLNNNIIPIIYEQGSLGASGDLALLSHMALPLLGLGEVTYRGKTMPASEAYKLSDLKPLEKLGPKEGLSLINGTQAMSAIGGLTLVDAFKLLNLANIAVTLTYEALDGLACTFDPLVHIARKQQGQITVAKQIANMLKGSKNTLRGEKVKVQDAYSLRCAPQVHGATLGALLHIKDVVTNEFNAVTDNPLVFSDENKIISAGNFHGEPLAFAFDYLAIAISELANISERRIERLVNPNLNNGLPAFLTTNSGINSGFMIVQYTAASLVSENKVLSHPASVDSIPSSANQEDHVSMGAISARKAGDVIRNTRKVIAMELLTAAQALGFKDESDLSPYAKHVYTLIRKHIPFITEDAIMYPYIHKVERLLADESFYNELIKGVHEIE